MTGQKQIVVRYISESGQRQSFKLSLIFACPDAEVVLVPKSGEISVKGQIATISAKISQISNDGIVQIKFSANMVASKDDYAAIMNSTAYFDGKYTRILKLKLSNPNGVSAEVKNFTWSVMSYEGKILKLKINFESPEYVSAF